MAARRRPRRRQGWGAPPVRHARGDRARRWQPGRASRSAGGLRSEGAVGSRPRAGAARVVFGTAALAEPGARPGHSRRATVPSASRSPSTFAPVGPSATAGCPGPTGAPGGGRHRDARRRRRRPVRGDRDRARRAARRPGPRPARRARRPRSRRGHRLGRDRAMADVQAARASAAPGRSSAGRSTTAPSTSPPRSRHSTGRPDRRSGGQSPTSTGRPRNVPVSDPSGPDAYVSEPPSNVMSSATRPDAKS